MTIRTLLASASCLCALSIATLSLAADKPAYGPPPAWVDIAPIPAAPEGVDQPYVALLMDRQLKVEGAGQVSYLRRVVKILKPEGLRLLSTTTQPWRPDSQTLTYNTIRILRGDQVIDLLAAQDMTVLRRETGLEQAMLDGSLTATKQIEGLQVGDILDIASTLETIDPVRKGKSDVNIAVTYPGVAGRLRGRYLWPTAEPMTWVKGDGLPTATVRQVGEMTELTYDSAASPAITLPNGAPGRFYRWQTFSLTEFKTWGEVSALMAPLYASATGIKPGSPLAEEVAKIKAASRDPKVRALMAFQLVQEKVRYFALGIGDGGYVPAAAELTWERRFGDCKGKTVLLLAILKDLGIEAEPTLVLTTTDNNRLDQRPPALGAFNHVLVKARIAGKVYWLDGTTARGSGDLDSVPQFPFQYALPVRAAGAELERVAERPSTIAETEAHGVVDLTKGVDAPATITMTLTSRGAQASRMQSQIASIPAESLRRSLSQGFTQKFGGITFTDVTWKSEPDGRFVVTGVGTGPLQWRADPETGVREYVWPSDLAGLRLFAPRSPGALAADWPYAKAFPNFNIETVEFLLPGDGTGFRAFGPKLNETIGGTDVTCTQTLAGARAQFRCEGQSLVDEITAAEADAANRRIRQISANKVILRTTAPTPATPSAPSS